MSATAAPIPRCLSRHLAAIGRKGGASTSERKRAAARANGRKGGATRKAKEKQTKEGTR